MTQWREALTILILFFFLGMALFSAGCTQAAVNEKPSVSVPSETTADQVADYRQTIPNRPDNLKNPEVSKPGISTVPEGNVCVTSGNNQSTCPPPATTEAQNPAAGTQIPDPAIAYCTDMGNLFEIRKNPDGSDAGVCILTDGTECDAIAYYDGTCPVAPLLEETPVDETVINEYEALCRAKNFPYEIKTRPDGSVHGVCIFPNGRECDAQDYYVGDCIDEMALEES